MEERINIPEQNNESENTLSSKILKHKIFLIFLFLLFTIEIFFREFLYSLSPSFIIFIQKNLSFLFQLGNFFSFFGNEKGQFLILVLSYNFLSTYKTIIIIFTAGLSVLIGGFLKLIYISPRPFMTNINIIIFNCEGGWGNPSIHSILSTCLYLTLYKVIIAQNKNFSNNEKKNYFCFTLFFIICICLSRLLLGVHSINQVIFGFCLGISIYYILFYIIELNSDDYNQFYYLIINLNKIVFYSVLIMIIALLPYFFIKPDSKNIILWDKIIDMKCPGYSNYKKFEYESFACIGLFTYVITSFIGCYIEFYYIFNSNISNWKRYNFNLDNDNEINFLNNDNKNTLWNSTDIIKSLKRLIFVILFILILLIPYFLIPLSLSYTFVLIFKMVLPVSFATFFMFCYLKRICAKFDLTNESLFENSIDV